MKLYNLNLRLFDGDYQTISNPNVTTQASLSPEMKTFYDMTLIDMAGPELIHDQFGQERDIPAHGGKTINFRKFAPLNKALEPLVEGVTPEGMQLSVSEETATVNQYGKYLTISDVLELTALDNTILESTKLIGRQAGLTLDTITRNELQSGTNVSFASKRSGGTSTAVTSRADLDSTATLNVDEVFKIVTKLRSINAPTIRGDYVAIIHPHVAYDLMRDPEWIDAHKYATPENIYKGEIGKIGGVRFMQTSEAKIFAPASVLVKASGAGDNDSFSVKVSSAVTSDATLPLYRALSAEQANALKDREVYVGGTKYTIISAAAGAAGAATITLNEAVTVSKDTSVIPAGGTKDGRAVYGCLFMADGAYGTTKITGGGLQTIIKQKGSAGTADPLDQRSTIGWKALKTAKILIPDYLVRFECCSNYGSAGTVFEN